MADRDKISHLKGLISTDERFVGRNGRLLVNKVQASAKAYDPDLIRLLMGDEQAREMFFVDIDGTTIFENDKFIWALEAQDYLEGSYTEYSQRIGLTVGGRRISDSDDVVLEFPYKDCVLEFDSTREDDDRPEVMMNETLMRDEIDCLFAPKVFTDAQIHNSNGVRNVDHMPDDVNGLLVKGNNLLVLHSLLPRYKGKVKLMYWDILYNTGDDRVPYNDSFKHSTWLVMMKNRLEIAKQLLRDDGVICLHCDDNEQAYLKVLCDECFGRINCVNVICVQMSNMSGQKVNNAIKGKKFPKLKEYLLIYAVDKSLVQLTIPKTSKESWDAEYNMIIPEWQVEDEALFAIDTTIANNKIATYTLVSLKSYAKKNGIRLTDEWKQANSYRIFASKPNAPLLQIAKEIESYPSPLAFISNASGDHKLITTSFNRSTPTARLELMSAKQHEGVFVGDIWTDISTVGGIAREGGVVLKNGKKPERLLARIITSITKPGDLVLDAYLGSGTTVAVCHKTGRKYIGIEQLERHMEMALSRITNVVSGEQSGISQFVNWRGGGSFVSCSLMTASKKYIQRANEATTDNELVDIFNELIDSPFVLYRIDLEKARDGFPDLSIAEKREAIVRVIDKNTLYVNYADIDDEDFDVSDEAKTFTRSFYTKGAK